MPTTIPVKFAAPQFLPLLAVPGLLLLVWLWQLWRRRGDVGALRHRRLLPVRERLPFVGELAFWLCLILASALTLAAISRPQSLKAVVRTAGVDFIILQDGSASMYVNDAAGGGNRWQRSMRFLRTMGESLRWEDDRMALALFAHIATPQIRLTKDPNTYFFFLDHLEDQSPFHLEDDGSWDTNIERGVYWGMRLLEKDEQIKGKSDNAVAFILVSDGQAWSGEVAKAMQGLQQRSIPLHVVGVGTTVGGVIPDPKRDATQAAVRSVLDRRSLAQIATSAGGRYFELDRDSDRDIANTIIDLTRRRAGSKGMEQGAEDLYRQFLFGAAGLVAMAVLFLRDRVALALQLAAAVGVLVYITSLM
jgi:Ca-activated chloride channel family protein